MCRIDEYWLFHAAGLAMLFQAAYVYRFRLNDIPKEHRHVVVHGIIVGSLLGPVAAIGRLMLCAFHVLK